MGKYDVPIEVAEGIYWVGYHDTKISFHSNPYLIVEGDKALLIDGGSRSDFPTVMMKILQVGIDPNNIVALVYQHADPDLCGSLANMLEIINNPAIEIYIESSNKIFLSHYILHDKFHLIKDVNLTNNFTFAFNGRALSFTHTPYAHSPGSFVTYDIKTKTLFSSDLFGSESTKWDLFMELTDKCPTCEDYSNCPNMEEYCPIPDILNFHKWLMPSKQALDYSINKIKQMNIETLAPQHGSVFKKKDDIKCLIEKMTKLDKVGIQTVLDESKA